MLRTSLEVVAVRVEATKAGKVVKRLQSHLLNLPNLRNVVDDRNKGMKLVLLKPNESKLELIQNQLKSLLRTESFSFVRHEVQIDCSEDASICKKEIKREKLKLPIGEVTFLPVDSDNVQQLHDINERLFPVKYNEAFYEYVVDAPEGYCKIDDGTAIGTVCCEVEKVKIAGKRRYRLCILTIGVFEEYRRFKLGTFLLDSVLTQARTDNLAYVYLHVQSCNTTAKDFYLSRGFQVTKLLRNYYPELDPPHCFVLRKHL
ncbi:Acetyltransferase [Phytophthora megakarya]|uniref:Acetyltransferase n=1 Tax=Phytophthora megakarya TaxID=4795 RepID=A0A225WLU9_9STRA|nr:Acetyltransferase [Phytophthora megakarya]